MSDTVQPGEIAGTGIKVSVGKPDALAARMRSLDKPGSHLWVYLVTFAVQNPRAEHVEFDTENLVSIGGPGCYKCEHAFSNRVARQPCRGSVT